MLSPLLAVLLSAASDSHSLPDLLVQRAADSAALERISPLPKSPTSSTGRTSLESARLEDATGPLIPGAVGVGFRVFGPTSRLHLQRALSSSKFLRLSGSFATRTEEEARVLTQTPLPNNGFTAPGRSKAIDVEQSHTEWEIQIAFGGLGLCQGSLCGTLSVGPFLGREITTTENAEILTTLDYEYRERGLLTRVGAAGSLGLHWQFRTGLALSADVGASWASLSGDRKVNTRSDLSDELTTTDGNRNGSELDVEFLGVGLDAWF